MLLHVKNKQCTNWFIAKKIINGYDDNHNQKLRKKNFQKETLYFK